MLSLGSAALFLLVFPGRHLLYPGAVSWTERGYRLSWRVMLNEKTGLVDYRIVEPATGKVWRAHPAEVLTPLQHQHMRTQPDMIRDYALHLHAEFLKEGKDTEVYADAWASLNGRPSQRLLRPELDLTQELGDLRAQQWILPLASGDSP